MQNVILSTIVAAICLPLPVAGQSAPPPPSAASPELIRLALEPVQGGIRFRFTFKGDVSPYVRSRLLYAKDLSGPTPTIPLEGPPTGSDTSFLLPMAALADWDSIETSAQLLDATDVVAYRSPIFLYNIAYLRSLVMGSNLADDREKALKDLKAQLKELTDAQAGLKGFVQATDMRLLSTFTTDRKLVFHFTVKGYGIVQGTLYDQNGRTVDTSTSKPSDKPYLVFDRLLQESTPYTLAANILSVQTGKPTGLAVSATETTGPASALTKLGIVEDRKDDTTVRLHITADGEGFYKVTYREQIAPTVFGPTQTVGGYDNDGLHAPTGAKISPSQGVDIDFPKGKADKTYLVTFDGVDPKGYSMTLNGPEKTISVPVPQMPKAPIPLDFDNTTPIVAQYTPSGVRLTWRATVRPDSASAELSSDLQDAPQVHFKASVSDDLKGEATVPIDQYASFVATITGTNTDPKTKGSKKVAPKPQSTTITIAMDGRTGAPRRRLQFAFAVSNETVTEAAAKGLIDDDTKSALLKMVKDVSSGNKVDWKKIDFGQLLTTGLGILFKFV